MSITITHDLSTLGKLATSQLVYSKDMSHDPRTRSRALRMVGGESRKSKRLFPVAGLKAFSNFRRVSPEDSVSKNTNLKGLT
jgi:hypothetical protein